MKLKRFTKAPGKNEWKSKLVIKGTDIELNGSWFYGTSAYLLSHSSFNRYRLTYTGQCAFLWHFSIWLLIWWKDAITGEINCINERIESTAWHGGKIFQFASHKVISILYPPILNYFLFNYKNSPPQVCVLWILWMLTNQKPKELTQSKQVFSKSIPVKVLRVIASRRHGWIIFYAFISPRKRHVIFYTPTCQSHMLLFVSVKHKKEILIELLSLKTGYSEYDCHAAKKHTIKITYLSTTAAEKNKETIPSQHS